VAIVGTPAAARAAVTEQEGTAFTATVAIPTCVASSPTIDVTMTDADGEGRYFPAHDPFGLPHPDPALSDGPVPGRQARRARLKLSPPATIRQLSSGARVALADGLVI
jgi:hypothetical protein